MQRRGYERASLSRAHKEALGVVFSTGGEKVLRMKCACGCGRGLSSLNLGHAVVLEDRPLRLRGARVAAFDLGAAEVPPGRAKPEERGPLGQAQQLPHQELRPRFAEALVALADLQLVN